MCVCIHIHNYTTLRSHLPLQLRLHFGQILNLPQRHGKLRVACPELHHHCCSTCPPHLNILFEHLCRRLCVLHSRVLVCQRCFKFFFFFLQLSQGLLQVGQQLRHTLFASKYPFLQFGKRGVARSNDTVLVCDLSAQMISSVSAKCVLHCNALQCCNTRCNTLQQRGAECIDSLSAECISHCSTLQYTAAHCSTLQHTAAHCSTLQHTAAHCSTLQHTAAHCGTLQHTAAHSAAYFRTLQHTITHSTIHCNTWVRRASALAQSVSHCNTV